MNIKRIKTGVGPITVLWAIIGGILTWRAGGVLTGTAAGYLVENRRGQ